MICKILETASAMRKINHLPWISELVFFPSSWWNSHRTCRTGHLHLPSVSERREVCEAAGFRHEIISMTERKSIPGKLLLALKSLLLLLSPPTFLGLLFIW